MRSGSLSVNHPARLLPVSSSPGLPTIVPCTPPSSSLTLPKPGTHMHRLPSITAIVPDLGLNDDGADDAAGLGVGDGVNVGSAIPLVSASSGADGACSFSDVNSSVPIGTGDCASTEKMISGDSSITVAMSATTDGFSCVKGIYSTLAL